MKISILQKNFKRGLSIVSHITSKNINLPILNNIKIEVEEKSIKLIATNLEIGVKHNMRGKIGETGACIVDSRILASYISLLPSKQVDIVSKQKKLNIECENYKTEINISASDEFPLIPVLEGGSKYRVGSEKIRKSLTQVIFAVSNNESRPDLAGVLFLFNAKELILVATDGYRLAERKTALIDGAGKLDDERQIIVPSKTILELIRIISSLNSEGDEINDYSEVQICIYENQIMFSVGGTEIVSKLIEGQFPDYQQVIPNKTQTECVLEKEEFVRGVKAVALFSKNDVNDIKIGFSNNKKRVTISSSSGQVGQSTVEIGNAVSGEENEIFLNYRYLIDGLNNIAGENIKLALVDKNSPCILRDDGDQNYIYIIMPIKQ
jgi:DNA polymerase III subunit beta